MECRKRFIFSKTNKCPGRKTIGTRLELAQNLHEETWNAVTFVGSLHKIHAVLYSKIADVHGVELHDVRTWNFFYLRNISPFLLHNTRDVTRGEGGTIPRAPIHCGGPKNNNNVVSTFFKTVHLLPKRLQVRTWGRQTCFFPQAPSNLVTPLHITIVQQNLRSFFTKYLLIRDKISITNYLKQNAVDYRSHLTIENKWKVQKRYNCSENTHSFLSPPKKTLGVPAEPSQESRQ